MTTMLERAARAAAYAWYKDDFEHEDALRAAENEWGDFVVIARAVLMAVRGDAPTKAMAESKARDDEGEFLPVCDLLDFSGENKTRTVLRQAWVDGIDAILKGDA